MAEKTDFPKGFLWGTATSAHQVEGNNIHSDWWHWESSRGGLRDGPKEKSGIACNQWELYEKDFQLARGLGNNAHRLSIEWAKVEPQEGQFDRTALDHYQDIVQTLKKLGLEPFVTLHHFTSPQWLTERGGWESQCVARLFTRYVEKVVTTLREDVKFWITINEPLIFLGQGWVLGKWPPQKTSFLAAWRVYRNLVRAHRQAYAVIHQISPRAQVGLAKNNQVYVAANHNPLNQPAAVLFHYLWNRALLKKIHRELDFIGLNYYFKSRVKLSRQFPFIIAYQENPQTDIGWEIYPPGVYQALRELKRYHKPIYITENGIADRADKLRPAFITDHLHYVKKAINAGVDVRGYFYWSLLDNFEWDGGFAPRFGLFAVDYKTQKRTPRQSAHHYKEICEANG